SRSRAYGGNMAPRPVSRRPRLRRTLRVCVKATRSSSAERDRFSDSLRWLTYTPGSALFPRSPIGTLPPIVLRCCAMNGFKLLIDTNVVVGLGDAQPVQASLAELLRVRAGHGIGLFVDGATCADVARDKVERRRAVALSKVAKCQQLRGIPV